MKRTRPKNSLRCLSIGAGMLAMVNTVIAAPSIQTATQVPVTADAQVRLALSNTNPNMLVVPGDRIVAIDSAQGMFLNGDTRGMTGQANGGVVLMTTQIAPFTFFVRTAGGLTVSVVAVPQKRDGRVVHLVSDQPVSHDKARHWEQSHSYVTSLIAIQKALLAGGFPEGFVKAPVTKLPAFRLPSSLSLRANQMWSGGALRVYQLSVRNTGLSPITLAERQFQAKGVRAVMIFPWGGTILPSAQAMVLVTVSEEG